MSLLRHVALTADRYIGLLNRLMLLACALIILALLFILSYDVLMRYVFDDPPDWTYDVSLHALLYILFLPLAYVQQSRQNIVVDSIITRMPKSVQEKLAVVATAICLFGISLISWSSIVYAKKQLDMGVDTFPPYHWPLFPILVIMPIGLCAASLQFLITLIKDIINAFFAKSVKVTDS